MIFDHAVKYNGKYYQPGAKIDVPEEKQEPAQKAENVPESAETADVKEVTDQKQEPAQKATRGRKKGDG